MERIMKKVKNERGSITVFILSTMLVIIAVIFTIYLNKMNKISNQEKELNKIQEEYLRGSTNDVMAQLYEESTANREPTLVRKWVNKIDGNGEEEFLDVEKTSDGGYIAVGYTTSTDISGLTNKGSADCLIAKYDANGNEQWKKSVGGSKYDWYNSVIEITDGTYIAVGTILSTDVVDKNGNNIGHGYDWELSAYGIDYIMSASEGIIGRYDTNGNEVSLKVTGESSDRYTAQQYKEEGGFRNVDEFDMLEYSTANALILGVDKTGDGSYVITGKKTVGVPSSFAINTMESSKLAIKYDKEGNKITKNELSMINAGTYFSPTWHGDYEAQTNSWKGLKEDLNENYYIYGVSNGTADDTICSTNSDLKNRKTLISSTYGRVNKLLMYRNNEFITLTYSNNYLDIQMSEFLSIQKHSADGSQVIWQKESENIGKTIKQISKSSESDFVGICEKDGNSTLAKFSVDDVSILEEYEIPTYENIYAIEGEDEFILLGTPTNEEGITITGTSGAVIAKYAIE